MMYTSQLFFCHIKEGAELPRIFKHNVTHHSTASHYRYLSYCGMCDVVGSLFYIQEVKGCICSVTRVCLCRTDENMHSCTDMPVR